MKYSFFDFLTLIGALGFFIYGMKVMSEGIQKLSGNKMRKILSSMTSNRVLGVFSGILITALIQSSSATTVLTVSFVNAGLLSLAQSIGVVLGANIGTTITAWIVAYFGFKVKISIITLPLIAVAFPLMFSKRSFLNFLSEFLIGFSLLFLGLEFLKSAVPNFHESPEILAILSEYTQYGVFSVLFFVLIGSLLTIIVQSSSAAMALTLVMCYEGWIPFDMAAGIVLGENIGTTITANLAAIVANVHAKRTARAHFIINVFGVLWMLFMMPFFLKFIDYILKNTPYFGTTSPYTDPHQIPTALSLFHTMFNLVNVLLMIWIIKPIEKLVIKLVPSRTKKDSLYGLEYISMGYLQTPELSIIESQKEIVRFGKIAKSMFQFFETAFWTSSKNENKKFKKSIEKIEKIEKEMNHIEQQIADYLLQISKNELSQESSVRIRSMLIIINDIERIGDTIFQMTKYLEKKKKNNNWFNQNQRDGLNHLFTLLNDLFDEMNILFLKNYSVVDLKKTQDLYKKLILSKKAIRKAHFKSIEDKDYNIKSGIIYTDLYTSCELIGSYILNITESVKGKI